MKHGTLAAYTQDGCRCTPCRTRWNAYQQWWRVTKRGRLHRNCPTCTCLLPPKPTDEEPTP